MKHVKNILRTLLFPLLMILMLFFPKDAMSLASEGLMVWYRSCVPALFPFMLLSSYLIRQNLTDKLTKGFSRILTPLLAVTQNGIYCILTGFLCGFPIGAKTIADLYRDKKLSKNEAQYLLSFCNNLGPAFFLGILLPSIKSCSFIPVPFFLFGMYGIPLLSAFLHTLLCGKCFHSRTGNTVTRTVLPKESCMQSLEASIQSAIAGITTLGAYLILGNLLFLIPLSGSRLLNLLTVYEVPEVLLTSCRCLIEITGGTAAMKGRFPLFLLSILPLGGICCILQTKSMLKGTDLSLQKYLLAKTQQSLFCFLYYFFLFRLFP